MRHAGLWAAAAAAALLWPAAALAQRAPGYASGAAAAARPLGEAQRLERHFLRQTAAGARFQWDAARLALARAASPALKESARVQLEREAATQAELLRLLQARGMALPIPDNEHAKVLKQLAKLSGTRFDHLYLDEMQHALQADIANHEKAAAQAEDPVLKAWAERRLPQLRQQLERAGRTPPRA